MKEKELTDEELVKAMEICSIEVKIHDKDDCKECPYTIKKIDCVTGKRSEKDFVGLVHRLQAKYHNLEINYNAVWEDFRKYEVENAEQKAIIERSKIDLENEKNWRKIQTKQLQAENERLTEERKTANMHDLMYWFNAYNECVNDCEKYVIEASENKAECIRLQKQVDELTAFKNEAISMSLYGKGRKDGEAVAVKDTAKEIWEQAKFIVNSTKNIVSGREYLHLDALKELIKAKGVEVE